MNIVAKTVNKKNGTARAVLFVVNLKNSVKTARL